MGSEETHPCLAPLCASQFVKDGTVAVIQERDGNAKKSELHFSVAKNVWQGSTLSSATFCLTFWSKVQELLERANSVRLVMGFISYSDDFTVSYDDDEADRLWDDTAEALNEIGVEIDQFKSCYTRQERTEWNHRTHSLSRRRLFYWVLRRRSGTRRQLTKTAPPWSKRAGRRRTNSLHLSRTSTRERRKLSGV